MKRGRHSRASRATYRSVARNVPPPAPRRGRNSQKEDSARRDRMRERRAGFWTKLFRALRMVFVLVFVCGTLGAGGWIGWQAVERRGLLALREIEISGNRMWDRNALLAKAGLELGAKLPFIPVSKVEAALRSLPGVAHAEVRRIYPSRLEITISEQEPVAMGRASGPRNRGWRGLAPDGAALPGLDLRASDLPVIDGFASLGEDVRARLGAFLEAARRDHPDLYASFSQLSARGGDLEIVLRDGRLKLLLDMTNKSLNSLEFLQALMRQQGGSLEAGRTIDMRVEGYAYVR